MIGAFKDTKEEAKALRKSLKRMFPEDDVGYTKTKQGFYYVWHEKSIPAKERKKTVLTQNISNIFTLKR